MGQEGDNVQTVYQVFSKTADVVNNNTFTNTIHVFLSNINKYYTPMYMIQCTMYNVILFPGQSRVFDRAQINL